jgi:hypothetical protein
MKDGEASILFAVTMICVFFLMFVILSAGPVTGPAP